MTGIVDAVERLVVEVREAAGARVKVGWISENDQAPLVTLVMQGSAIRPLDQTSSKLLYELRFQLDIWHTSPKQRDDMLEQIVRRLGDRDAQARNGWFGVRVEGVTDVEEGPFFRKIAMLRLKTIG